MECGVTGSLVIHLTQRESRFAHQRHLDSDHKDDQADGQDQSEFDRRLTVASTLAAST